MIGGPPPGPLRELHLVDLARALADSLGVALDPAAHGRPWSAALADPAADATLPGPGPVRTLLAALLALAGLLALRPGPADRSVHAHPRRDLLLAALLACGLLAVCACGTIQTAPPNARLEAASGEGTLCGFAVEIDDRVGYLDLAHALSLFLGESELQRALGKAARSCNCPVAARAGGDHAAILVSYSVVTAEPAP